ncbi:MAG TPA: cell division protein FtsQ/DivIB [Gammaproteobacteria bacterium]|nr:cell division protein FtsQ/DivIB [Gammaproteobacteria bacterium]
MTLSRARKHSSNLQIPWKQGAKILLFIFLVILSIFSINKIKQTDEFPIHQVKIYGAKHLNPKEIQRLLMPLVSKGFFAVEVDQVKEQLLQAPWIANASVTRIWPDQVLVTITEHQPIARWNENNLLSSTGEIFTPDVNSYPAGLPHFIGPEGQQITMLEFYSKLNDIFHPLHLKITRLQLSPYLSWDVEFVNGMKMRLGYKDILTRVSHFVKVYSKIVGERAGDVDYIDLRYPNGLAIRWKTVS